MSLADWTIARKVGAAFTGVVAIVAATGAFTVYQVNNISVLNKSLEGAWNEDIALRRAEFYLARQENSLRGYILSQDAYYLERLNAHRANFKKQLTVIESNAGGDAAQLQRIADTAQAADGWHTGVVQRVDGMIQSGGVADAIALVGRDGEADGLMEKAENNLDVLTKATDGRIAAERKEFADLIGLTVALAIVGVLLAAALAAFAGLLLARTISRPVRGLTSVMERLAVGDLSVDIASARRGDEIGAMSRAVQVFKDNAVALKTASADKDRMEGDARLSRERTEADRARAAAELAAVVEETGVALSALSEGDLSHRIHADFPGEYRRLKDDFNLAMGRLEEAMSVITANATAMQSGVGEISQAADDLSRRTEQQAATLEETAAALEEITATVKKTAEGAQQANSVVTGAKADAEQSGVVVSNAVAAMGEIERSADQISQIIGVIDEIAFQTNLLALNAGVEAARAGDAGKGFAVVAQEVRALAQRSAEAAKEIKALITASSQQVGQGVQLVGQTGEALRRIVERVAEITGLVSEITASTQEQATGLSQVNIAVNQMDQATQQNAAMVEQSTAASHALSQEALELVRLVARFRTSGAAPVARAAPVAAPIVATPAPTAANSFRNRYSAPALKTTQQVRAAPVDDSWEEF
ncbi:HAMP domain-containing protein [Caulobacter sp. SLTY]|uniref:methyl-accepting chemotaxis protein n=1 Tax=Caulobacter sp. SLTY TaxID=2683262 RepID=UPI0014132A6A|nr:methyl-accepting chemotaxis protein [Caulobacter sp. SLTY]NBB15045.1 HAMP domain-containing protein [Caulobacter sp. SLTY]